MNDKTSLPPIGAFGILRVEDFDAWHQAFDSTMAVRKSAGVLSHSIARGLDDANVVRTYMDGADRTRFEAFMKSPDLASRLRSHGVLSHQLTLVVPQEDHMVRTGGPYVGALVTIEVEDYDRWKAAFDARPDVRKKAGLLGHGITRSADRPNQVISYHQAESVQSLRAFFGATDLRAAMEKSGVRGEPQVSFFQGVGSRVSYG
jgi:hypothetical protein